MTKDIKKKKRKEYSPTFLVILDGFGLTDPNIKGNAITPQTAPNIFSYMEKYPNTTLTAHGTDVGLFPNQEGNSEAGHLNIGAGRIVEQDLVTISKSVKDGTFFKKEAFKQALHHAEKYKTRVHVMGLLTDGQSAHASPEYLYALLELFRKENVSDVCIHLFTDGRDSPPHSAVEFLGALRKFMKNGEKIASITGRFYGMDRNKIWQRTQKAYEAIVLGKGLTSKSAEEAVAAGYNRNETDEYISPTVIVERGKPVGIIDDNDVIFFFNSRSDRARQITKAFVQKDFQKQNPGAFKRTRVAKNIRFVAMADFGPDLPGIFTAFPSPDIHGGLVETIDERARQLYISETEKYAHVTYFINGGSADPTNGEMRSIVRSSGHDSYADHPEMECKKITNQILTHLQKQEYDFIAVNFPNADMVGHTGDFEAAKRAVSKLDEQIKRLVDAVIRSGGVVLITADHGNAEEMINKKAGEVMTEHTTNPVPCILVGMDKKNIKMKKGRLADIAPTVLKIMGMTKSKEMTGRALY
ncbi:MAG: 2,3-bisphosphoglycerate-independent phosphoglycerate mutase [Candidatus Magasanikbacteria bacterium]